MGLRVVAAVVSGSKAMPGIGTSCFGGANGRVVVDGVWRVWRAVGRVAVRVEKRCIARVGWGLEVVVWRGVFVVD